VAAREADRPKIAPAGWLVFGRALQPDGRPASGVHVRVADAGDTLEGLPSDEPDAVGDFSVTYRRQDFPKEPEQLPDLHVVAEDQKGQLLYRSDATVRFQEGRAEYVEITVREEPVKRGRTARKGSRQAAAPKRPGRSRSAKPRR
jgi:hypothetical protein